MKENMNVGTILNCEELTMYQRLVTSSTLTRAEVSRRLNLDKGRLTRLLNGQLYTSKNVYDDIYNLVKEHGAEVPVNEELNLSMYPSGRELGTWDIYVGEKFIATLVFYDLDDVMKFSKGDERCMSLLSFAQTITTFVNRTKSL